MSEQVAKRARPVVGKVTPVCHEICPNHFGLANDLRCTLDRGHAEAHRHHLCEWLNLDRNAHIANLEWRVVEAAVKWRVGKAGTSQDWFEANESLASAVDVLIAAREAELKEE